MDEKITKEVARLDVERFLNAFKIDPIKRKKLSESIETLTELLMFGMAVITDDCHIKYILLEPIESTDGTVMLSELTFKNKRTRLDDLKGVQTGSEIDKVKALVELMTGANKAILGKITGDDFMYINEIACFFLPAQSKLTEKA